MLLRPVMVTPLAGMVLQLLVLTTRRTQQEAELPTRLLVHTTATCSTSLVSILDTPQNLLSLTIILDPRVDADQDGSKTYGGNKTHT